MSAGGNLPDEIIREIHIRLPTKSLGRFRCVSKSWQTLISDPKDHLIRNNRRRPKVLLSYGQFFDVVDMDGEPRVSSSKIDSTHEWICLYGSCDGLNLALAQNYQLFLLNPTTQECKKLPNSGKVDFDNNIACGLGYDSDSDDYKVVISDFGVVNVYSLRSDAWKTFQASPFDNDAAILKRCPGIFMNGSIHWFCFLPCSVSIVAFDLAEEKFKNVPLPRLYHPLAHQQLCLSLYEIGGCLCFLDDFHEIEVWVMKDYGIESSWTKFCGVTKWDVNWVHQFFESRNHVRPVFYLPDEELVFIQDAIYGIKVITYDVKEKTSWDFKLVHTFDLMCTFQDSLVSPEQFSRGTTASLHSRRFPVSCGSSLPL